MIFDKPDGEMEMYLIKRMNNATQIRLEYLCCIAAKHVTCL